MSEESKQAIKAYYAGEHSTNPFADAYAIVKEYAGSENANPKSIPWMIEQLTHLFATGEIKK